MGAEGAAGEHLVDVAVVVDVSVREDVEIDSAKVDLVGQALVDVGLSTPAPTDEGAAEQWAEPQVVVSLQRQLQRAGVIVADEQTHQCQQCEVRDIPVGAVAQKDCGKLARDRLQLARCKPVPVTLNGERLGHAGI